MIFFFVIVRILLCSRCRVVQECLSFLLLRAYWYRYRLHQDPILLLNTIKAHEYPMTRGHCLARTGVDSGPQWGAPKCRRLGPAATSDPPSKVPVMQVV